MADLKIVISALNKASGDIQKVKGDIEGIGTAGKNAEGGLKDLNSALGDISEPDMSGLITGLNQAWEIALKAAEAIGVLYDITREGAAMEFATTRFGNLAESIGTTADVLLVDLRTATRGTISDMELVASASQLMQLGLADNHDEVVRLARVAGALGMNMNQLVLALANKTTMRFDQLGISVVGFDDKVKALEKTGLSAEEAFGEAFLQQAEEAIGITGDVADSTLGSMMQMEAASKNLGDAIKMSLADSFQFATPTVTNLANGLLANVDAGESFRSVTERMDQALRMNLIDQTEYNAMLKEMGVRSNAGIVPLEKSLAIHEKLDVIFSESALSLEGYVDQQYELINSLIDASPTWRAFVQSMDEAGLALGVIDEQSFNAEKAFRAMSTGMDSLARSSGKLPGELMAIGSELAVLEGKLSDAQLELDIAIKTFHESVAGDLAKGLRDAGLEGEDLEKRLGILDEMFGTSYVMEYKLELATDDLLQTLINDPDGFAAEFAVFDSVFTPLIGSVAEAQGVVDDLQSSISALEGQYNVIVRITQVGDVPTIPGTGATPDTGVSPDFGNEVVWDAVGGNVYAGNPYGWQEYGYRGELFVPSQDGYILSRAEAERALARAIVDGKSGGSEIDYQRLADVLSRAVNTTSRGQKGGNTYNLNVQGGGSPSRDVAATFDLLRAYGGNY
jgi:hypothetical protein